MVNYDEFVKPIFRYFAKTNFLSLQREEIFNLSSVSERLIGISGVLKEVKYPQVRMYICTRFHAIRINCVY